MTAHSAKSTVLLVWLLASCTAGTGCQSFFAPVSKLPISPIEPVAESDIPREKMLVTLPAHVIEPPDVLLIDAVKIVPKSPYVIDTLDTLSIQVSGTPPEEPIAGAYTVDGGGAVDLGPTYGTVKIVGLTIDEARSVIQRYLSRKLESLGGVSISLLQLAGVEQITGDNLVAMDGTVNLGSYGTVHVAGLTVDEAAKTIEKHLDEFLETPKVIVDVLAYNSKTYYIITEGAGLGDSVIREPITGNETVLDAIASIGGLSRISSHKMWISRPAPSGTGYRQILPINWKDITRSGFATTNYQLLPGDRLFIAEDKLTKTDSVINKIVLPFERIIGFVSLGTGTLNSITRIGLSISQNR